MIDVRYHGRLGNNLFQYALGRILAERLGIELRAAPIEGFPRTFDRVGGRSFSHKQPIELQGHKLNLDQICSQDTEPHLLLTGYFQNYSIFKPYSEKLREWFQVEERSAVSVDKSTLIVSARLGDFCDLGLALHYDYYATLLRRIEYDRLLIVSDEIDHPLIGRLAEEFQGTSLRISPIETIVISKRCQSHLISNSTFSWWAAFLSDAEEIHLPIPNTHKFGAWGIGRFQDGVDLRVDEPRYTYHYNSPVGFDPLLSMGAGGWQIAKVNDPALTHVHRNSTAFWWKNQAILIP